MADSSPVLVGCSECEPGAVVPSDAPMRRISRWLPIFTAWVDDSKSLSVLAIEDVDPGRLQCKVYAHDGPGGIVKAHQLRFMNPETLESWLQRAQRCAPADRHHRCTCCLEWIYRHARATGAARPRAPSRSRMVIIQPCRRFRTCLQLPPDSALPKANLSSSCFSLAQGIDAVHHVCAPHASEVRETVVRALEALPDVPHPVGHAGSRGRGRVDGGRQLGGTGPSVRGRAQALEAAASRRHPLRPDDTASDASGKQRRLRHATVAHASGSLCEGALGVRAEHARR